MQKTSRRPRYFDWFAAAKGELTDLVYPPACRLCGDWVPRDIHFCRTCHTQLELTSRQMQQACGRCGLPAPAKPRPNLDSDRSDATECHTTDRANEEVREEASEEFSEEACEEMESESKCEPADHSNGTLPGCARCQKLEFHFDEVIARWLYRERVCDAVVACKFSHQAALADALAHRLADHVVERFCDSPARDSAARDSSICESSARENSARENSDCENPVKPASAKPDAVTFVASHFLRQFTRGGNGNRVFAQVLAKRLDIPVIECLRLSRRIEKQAWLDDEARKRNVLGAFSIRKSYALFGSPKLTNRHILLVDDVLTTGATANEVSKVLKAAGASRVTLAVTARAFHS